MRTILWGYVTNLSIYMLADVVSCFIFILSFRSSGECISVGSFAALGLFRPIIRSFTVTIPQDEYQDLLRMVDNLSLELETVRRMLQARQPDAET